MPLSDRERRLIAETRRKIAAAKAHAESRPVEDDEEEDAWKTRRDLQ